MQIQKTALICALAAAAPGCFATLGDPNSGGGGGGGASLGNQCRGDFGSDEAGRQFTTFLQASAAFIDTSNDIEARMRAACQNLGTDLAMSSAEMAVNGNTTLAVCNQVSAKIRAEMDAIRATPSVKARFETTEPVCTTKIEEYRSCIERCDVKVVREGRVEYRCEGGELRGSCNAQCSGQCAVDVQGQCSGSCEGTCSGGCNGVCNGTCEGECTARDGEGRCTGTCRGTCRGTCSGGCTGSCSGRCVASAQAACSGECRGGCSVEFQRPVCTGRIVPPEVKTECRQMCDSVQVSHQECTPGEARLIVDASGAAEAAERAQRVTAAVAARVPEIVALGHRLGSLRQAGQAMIDNVGGFASTVGAIGGNAILCSAEAAAALPRAVSNVSVSFQVSVEVSASVDGSARVR